MATFPSITPTYGVSKTSNPNTRTTKFGDGYQARITFGMNQNPKNYQLTFNVSETDLRFVSLINIKTQSL